jgi:hypothetical protein
MRIVLIIGIAAKMIALFDDKDRVSCGGQPFRDNTPGKSGTDNENVHAVKILLTIL